MMQTRRNSLNVLTIFLTLLITISMLATTSLAVITEEDRGVITVSGAEDTVTVSAYRLMDVTYNYDADQPQQPVYTWTSDVAGWVQANFPAYIDTENDNTVLPAFNEDADADTIAAFYDRLSAGIKTGTPSIAAAGSRTGNGNIENLEMGNYLILIENGMRVYRPSAVNLVPEWNEGDSAWEMTTPAAVEVKSSEPTITKTVSDNKKADNASIGDTVTFDITADIPQFPANALAKNYVISDFLPSSLTLTEGSINVYGVLGEAETPLTLDTEYSQNTVRPNEGGTSTFTLTFDYEQISDYEKIHIEYTATLNENAVVGEDGNVNNAYLDYTNNPYTEDSWESKTNTSTVYTYGLDISKVDKDHNDTFLAGAEFELYASLEDAEARRDPIGFIQDQESEGVYRKALENEVGTITTLTVGSNGERLGKLTLNGLDETTWYLVETKAPDSYNILEAPVPVTIVDAKEDVLDGKVTDADIATGLVPLTVENDDGFQLPTTGGMGTILFTAVGIVLMGAAVILFIVVRRKRRAED